MKISTLRNYSNLKNYTPKLFSKNKKAPTKIDNYIKTVALSSLMLMSMTPSLLNTAVKAQENNTQKENNLINQLDFSKLPTYIQPDCIEFAKNITMYDKKYTMFFVNTNKFTGDNTPSVTDVFFVPEDYEQVLDRFVDEINSPPRLLKIMPIKKNGKFTNQLKISVSETTCNSKGKKINKIYSTFYAPANIENDLINLVSEKSQYKLLNENLKNTTIYEE